ncbi:MAG: hypothetical protein K6357_06090 [Elusimicrobiota bacterium]
MKEKIELIEDIVQNGLNSSIDRINRISSFKWEIKDIEFKLSKDDFDCICVYLIASNFNKIAFSLFIKTSDLPALFKDFSGHLSNYLMRIPKVYEVLASEIGNIIMNSVLSELANRMNKAIIPDVPRTLSGSKSFLLENISAMIEENKNKTVISSVVSVKTEQKNVKIELYFFFENDIMDNI